MKSTGYRLFVTTTILVFIFLFSTCKPVGLGTQVDISSPEVTLGSYADGTPIKSGDYVSGSITLNGTFDDDLTVKSVEASIDGGETFSVATIDTETKSWSFPIITTNQSDGEKDITIRVTDSSDKSSTVDGFLIFDNTAPLVMITVAPGYDYVATDQIISIKGETADPYRIRTISSGIDSELVSITSINGTYSWSIIVNAEISGTYPIDITATDYAGNTSTVVFIYDEIKDLNANKVITAEQANLIYSENATITDFPLTKALMSGATHTILDLVIDLSLDQPQITINNPIDGDALGGGAVIIGRVLDDDGVELETVLIAFDLSEAQLNDPANYSWDDTNPVNVKSESGLSLNFVYEIPSTLAPSVPHTLHVIAADDNGLKGYAPYPDTISFTFDAGAPQIEVTSHESGAIEDNTSVLISGTATDDGVVEKVEYSLDSGSTWTEIIISPPGNTSWSDTIDFETEGAHNIKFKATDDNDGIAIYNLYIEIDTVPPVHGFISPLTGTFVNGFVEVRGSFSDNNGIKESYVLVGTETPSNPYRLVTNPNSWTYQFNSQEYDNATYATEASAGSGVWNLIISTKAIDHAGNIYDSITDPDDDYILKVDNELDRPLVVILNPSDGASIGGSTRVTGNASDDDAVYKVYMSIDVNGDGLYTKQFDLNGNTTTDQASDTFEDETQWYELTGTSVWSVDLNGSGEFYSPTSTDTLVTGDGNINIRVRAQDTKDAGVDGGDIFGDAVSIAVRFDDTIPFVANVTPETGDYVSKIVDLEAEFFDDEQIDKMYISFNNGGSYKELSLAAEGSDPEYSLDHITTNPVYDQYNLLYSINSEEAGIASNILNGLLYVRLKLIDNANYQYIETVTLSIDNTFPSTTITDNGISDVTGTAFSIQGQATDTGPVSGIEKIEVYITDKANTTFYQPDTFTTTQSTAGQTKDLTISGGGSVTYPIAYPSMIVTINDLNEDGVDGTGDDPADGYDEGLTYNSGTYEWYFLFDTSGFEDGEYTVHAIGNDHALNGFYTSADIFIKNNKPAISIDVGIDLNGIAEINPEDQVFNYDPLVTLYARNDYVELRLTGTGGNGSLTYSVLKDGIGTNLINATTIAKINTATYTEDTLASFTCAVTDDKGISAIQIVEFQINNEDSTAPTANITAIYDRYDGNKYLYIGEDDGEDAWGYWLEAGSLFIPWSIDDATVSGHIEPVDAGNYDGWDPDVSGTLLIRGKVHDNQRVQSVQIWIDKDKDSTQDAGEVIDVTTVNGSTGLLTATGANGLINDPDKAQTLTATEGHDFYFVYSWNTSEINNMANTDITIEVIATDWSDTPRKSTREIASSEVDEDFSALKADVMPYIHTIKRTDKTTSRSRFGKYPVTQGETNITLSGWNLGRDTTPSKAAELGNTSWNHTSHNDLTADTTWEANNNGNTVTLDMSATGNGLLWMQVNSIPLLNNNNVNARLQNIEEDNTGNALLDSKWTDDRYFRVWETDDAFDNTNSADHLSMSIHPMTDPTVGDRGKLVASFIKYGNSSLNYSYPDSDGNSNTPLFTEYDPPEFSNIFVDAAGIINIAFVSNMLGGTNWGTQESGAVCAWAQSGPNNNPWDQSPDIPYLDGINFWASERLVYDQMLWQFNFPQITRNSGNVHVSYFDSFTQTIKYVYFQSGDSSALQPWVVIDGPTDAGNGDDDSNIGNGAVSTFATGLTASTGVSSDSSIIFDEDKNPLIIYYDTISRTMRLARTDTNQPNLASEWKIQQVLGSSDSNKEYTGTDVQAIADTAGIIHVAGYNVSNGDLIYSSAPDNGDSSPRSDYTFASSTIVDEIGAVGTGIDISLDGTVPYISYIDNSQSGTLNAVKIAYKDGSNWCYETLPLEFASVENVTQIEVSINPAKTWSVAIGYKSNNQSRFELIYLLKDL